MWNEPRLIRQCSSALQLHLYFGVCEMWESAAIGALLILCIGVMYALRQIARMEERLRVLLETQSEHVRRMQMDALRRSSAHVHSSGDILSIDARQRA